MSPYAEPSPAVPSLRPVISELIKDDAGNASFTVTFAPSQELPLHRNASRILIQVLEGNGAISVRDDAPQGVIKGDQVQVPPHAPHAVFAGPEGMKVQVHLIPDCCTAC